MAVNPMAITVTHAQSSDKINVEGMDFVNSTHILGVGSGNGPSGGSSLAMYVIVNLEGTITKY